MDEEFFPWQNRKDSPLNEGLGGEEDRKEEMGQELSVAGHGCSSERVSSWGSLPDVCLRHVYRFLTDRDRRNADLVCHHWHNVMRSPSLWRFRFFHFNGRLSKYRQSESSSAVDYVRSLGVYLEQLEVCVCPPRRSLVARRLEQTIRGLFSELTRVNAPLKSLYLMRLGLDQPSWTLELRNSLVECLILFLRRGASRLTFVCLSGMRISMNQGLEVLSVLAQSQRGSFPRCSSLDLKGFFSRELQVHHNSEVPRILRYLQGLTDLSLSYSCLSDELLIALQHRKRGWRDVTYLQTFSLHCTLNEPHEQVVCGCSWATLASSCPGLKVKLTVDQIIDTNKLAGILLPEIPLTEYSMTAFYSPDQNWSTLPLLCCMLPRYRHSLQNLCLDLSNCNESLDEELLELVKVCEHLEQLRIWAFLEISTVQRLLHFRLTKKSSLNQIRVRVYSINEETKEQEDQLKELLSSYLHLPPELDFFAKVYPFV
ncbi:F-box only protein 39-like [Etheostoma cragini]|uniref:F-box only protein 39-like n=1 Tax=Etheostoma cragini TaxID=417921 RepID=UPI00155F109F|nr:F-box only protein 39-like [Etheostoma cragini]